MTEHFVHQRAVTNVACPIHNRSRERVMVVRLLPHPLKPPVTTIPGLARNQCANKPNGWDRGPDQPTTNTAIPHTSTRRDKSRDLSLSIPLQPPSASAQNPRPHQAFPRELAHRQENDQASDPSSISSKKKKEQNPAIPIFHLPMVRSQILPNAALQTTDHFLSSRTHLSASSSNQTYPTSSNECASSSSQDPSPQQGQQTIQTYPLLSVTLS